MIAGLSIGEIRHMEPGLVLDLFIYRRNYDDMEHRIIRKLEKIYD